MNILVLVHMDLVPPENVDKSDPEFEFKPWITEYNVICALKELGHNVLTQGVYSDLLVIRNAVEQFKPNIADVT